ncbi:MAG TPA: C40 family peptidase [Streptosporangiaceae bacterium]|nr:C40 family peptidase [Streptosporangiaceae bacterium]
MHQRFAPVPASRPARRRRLGQIAAIAAAAPLIALLASPRPAGAANQAAARVSQRLEAWHYARRQIGKPYRWGGTGPASFDCSGLVYAAYMHAGITLPRTTQEMLASPLLIRITKRQARRGDLAFFGTGHVELYAWGNWTFGAAHTGTRIGFHRMNSFWHPTMYFKVRARE